MESLPVSQLVRVVLLFFLIHLSCNCLVVFDVLRYNPDSQEDVQVPKEETKISVLKSVDTLIVSVKVQDPNVPN